MLRAERAGFEGRRPVASESRLSLHVLVVDDDDADAMMIDEALSTVDPPAMIHRVSDGREAIDYLHRRGAYAEATRPDLILLDLNMPVMNGHEVLAEVKADDALKVIPVVVLTTSSAIEDVVSSYEHRANAYVTKPIDLDSFEAAVREINDFYRDVAVLPR
jgi:CheY-like chemotaxis protein